MCKAGWFSAIHLQAWSCMFSDPAEWCNCQVEPIHSISPMARWQRLHFRASKKSICWTISCSWVGCSDATMELFGLHLLGQLVLIRRFVSPKPSHVCGLKRPSTSDLHWLRHRVSQNYTEIARSFKPWVVWPAQCFLAGGSKLSKVASDTSLRSLSAMARVTSGMSGGFHIGAPSKIDLKIPCSEGSESQSDTCAPSMHWETRLSKAAKFLAGTRNFCKGVLTVICIWSTARAFSIKVGKHDISIFCQFNAKSGIQRAFGMFRPQDLGYPTVSFWSIPIDVGRQGKIRSPFRVNFRTVGHAWLQREITVRSTVTYDEAVYIISGVMPRWRQEHAFNHLQ